MGKTLYISDLDGTLLNSDALLSEETIDTIREIINRGEIFSVATARSFFRSEGFASSLQLKHPIIVYNGSFLADPITKETTDHIYFDDSATNYLKNLLNEHNILPNVFSFIDGRDRVSLIPDSTKEYYLKSRTRDKRMRLVNKADDLYLGKIFHYLCVGKESELQEVYDILKIDPNLYCVFQKEVYSHEHWLDIAPKEATKGKAALKLKQLLNCDKIVAFRR